MALERRALGHDGADDEALEVARKRIGDARWLHVAQSYFHDIVPARRLGIASAWINRTRQKPSGPERPDVEFGTLAEAADWLAAGGRA